MKWLSRSSARILLVSVLVACSGSSPQPSQPPHQVVGCSPLAPGDAGVASCLLPFPNAWFEQSSSQTATGLEIVYPDGTLPSNVDGVALRQASFGTFDGFSPATTLVVWFPQGVQPSALIAPANAAASLAPQSPIALVDMTTGQRVAFFSELDENADPDAGEEQALLLHPMARLVPARRYAVAITTALDDAAGDPLQPTGQFAEWAAGTLPAAAPLAQIASRLDQDAQAFAALGIQRSQLALAWDFDTASEAQLTGRLVQMRDDVLAAAPQGLGYQISVVAYDDGGIAGDAGQDLADLYPDAGLDAGPYGAFRIIDGTFEAPSFEVGPDPSLLAVTSDGGVVMGAPASWNFTAVIPECAAHGATPVPLVIIGPGLFDDAHNELMDDRALLEQLCMVGVSAEWLGLDQEDYNDGLLAGTVLPDANQFGLITDRLQQAHANFQVLTRLAMNGLSRDPAFQVNGRPVYDPTQRYYWGASNGGIQGTTYLALSPDIPRGVLNVPGSEWSFMIWRSADFSDALIVLDAFYPDKLEQQLLIALSQSLWDRTDPIEFSPHLAAPLPGVPAAKPAIFQESIGDAQVPNLATEAEMRTIGALGLAPLVVPPYDITAQSGPLGGLVYTQWDVQPTPMPSLTNVPPADNAAHEACRHLPLAIQQAVDFLTPSGQAVQTCDGGCLLPPGSGS